MSTQITTIVDYTAQVAASIPGVTGVYGCGAALLTDPLTGGTIQPAPDAPTGAYTHWSDLPGAWKTLGVQPLTQDGTNTYTWDIPMRLWLPRADMANLRRTAIPFYALYAAAFMSDPSLGGLATSLPLLQFRIGMDKAWGWLDINLELQEIVH